MSLLMESVRLEPTSPIPRQYLAKVLLAGGRPEEALAEAERITVPPWRLMLSAAACHALGRGAESDRTLGELVKNHSRGAAFQVAEVYVFRGETDRAFEWLERARDQRDSGLFDVTTDFMLEKIRGDVRYAAFLRKMHLAK